jgi:hypothetical protein
MKSKHEAINEIQKLIKYFEANYNTLMQKSGEEGEREIEEYLITPFFKALGWFDNSPDTPSELKDVKFQYRISLKRGISRGGSGTKKVDYAFRINGVNQFFLEAKIPSRNLRPKNNKISQDTLESIWQAKTYGWGKDVPIVILTDFEEFRVFNTISKPNKKRYFDQIVEELDLNYTDYLAKFDLLWNTFSKESVINGSLEKYKVSTSLITRQTIDEALLESIDKWRRKLAENIIYNLKKVNHIFPTSNELTNIVQTIIDRILFIRFLEDNNIEQTIILKKYLNPEYNSKLIYCEIVKGFISMAPFYNGSIFGNKNNTHPADKVIVSNTTIKSILSELYDDSPYDFSVIPIEIIGRIYERFLGKIINVTEKGGFSIDLKEDIRKEEGIFYTPKFVVDYIVDETVGKLIKGKNPSEIKKMKVLDPACGSGSFLLSAFEKIIKEHEKHYYGEYKNGSISGKGKDWIIIKDGDEDIIKITVDKKKEILINNIYGVDLDNQAVEVAQMSLYLKLLEDESFEVKQTNINGMSSTVLPNLSNNIITGNSLIGTNIGFLPPSDILKINPKNYEDIFNFYPDEKFHAVIGNPPYLNIDGTWGKKDIRLQYLKNNYSDIYNDKTDILFYFLYKGVNLSQDYVGFIVSRAFLEAYKANKLRKWLSQNTTVHKLIDFRNYYVFKGVGITTCILILKNKRRGEKSIVYKKNDGSVILNNLNIQLKQKHIFEKIIVPTSSYGEGIWAFVNDNIQLILNKIDIQKEHLGNILLIGQGMQTGCNNVFGEIDENLKKELEIPDGMYYIRARNSDIQKYSIKYSGEYLLYLEDIKFFKDLPEKINSYILSHKAELQKRAAFKRGNCDWWRYTWPLHKEHFYKDKLYCPYLANTNRFALDAQNKYLGLTDTTVLYDNGQKEDLRYFLALLNSELLSFRFRYIGKLKSNNIYEYVWNSVSKVPVKRIDFNNIVEKNIYNELIEHTIMQIEYSNKILNGNLSNMDKNILSGQSNLLQKEIDSLIYKLYDINKTEINLVQSELYK